MRAKCRTLMFAKTSLATAALRAPIVNAGSQNLQVVAGAIALLRDTDKAPAVNFFTTLLTCQTGTAARRYMGAILPGGGWVRLEVPASLVGLEGRTLNGMAFSLWGRASWDRAGKR